MPNSFLGYLVLDNYLPHQNNKIILPQILDLPQVN